MLLKKETSKVQKAGVKKDNILSANNNSLEKVITSFLRITPKYTLNVIESNSVREKLSNLEYFFYVC